MDERARNKRKLRDMQEAEADSEEEEDDVSLDLDVEREKPGEGLKKMVLPTETETEETASKKPRFAEDGEPDETLSEKQKEKAEKKAAKQKKKEEKDLKKKAKQEAKSDKPVAEQPTEDAKAEPAEKEHLAPEKKDKQRQKKGKDVIRESTESETAPERDAEMEQISVPGLVDEDDSTSASASTPRSPVFDTTQTTSNPSSVEAASTTTSLASAVAPSEKPRHIKIPTDTTALRARLAARIEALRAARKADGSDGKPILTRAELIEERRRKQAQRNAHKKELRLKAKQEEDLKREEALASARNSPGGSLMSPMIPVDDEVETSFSFGRVAFADGTTLSRDLTYEKEAGGDKKKKLDPKSALAKVEAQKRRLAELDEEKRKDILEKEGWLAARRKAEGEKVRDDETLLKKAVKRKEKTKQKSDKEWKERKAGVAKGIHDRQKKREANLQARRDGKGQKGKKKNGPTKKKAARPGFEGSFSVGGGKKR